MANPYVYVGGGTPIGYSLSSAGYRSRTNYRKGPRSHLDSSVIVGWQTGPINQIQRRTYELLADNGHCTLIQGQGVPVLGRTALQIGRL